MMSPKHKNKLLSSSTVQAPFISLNGKEPVLSSAQSFTSLILAEFALLLLKIYST